MRNVKVAIVKSDMLGAAFNVDAFHRCQVNGLIREQIILVNMKMLLFHTQRYSLTEKAQYSSLYIISTDDCFEINTVMMCT